MYEIFEQLCLEHNVTPYRVCKETGLTTATISNWKAGRYTPKADKLQIIADYFGVPLSFLLTGKMEEETKEKSPELSSRDEKDISRRLEQTLEELESQQGGLMFDGQPLDDETKELLKASLEHSIRVAKINAKKYTPKKYLKET